MCTCRSIARQIEILIFRYIHSNNKTLNLYTLLALGNSQDMSSLLCGEHKSLFVHEMWKELIKTEESPLVSWFMLTCTSYILSVWIPSKIRKTWALITNTKKVYVIPSLCRLYHYILNNINWKFLNCTFTSCDIYHL